MKPNKVRQPPLLARGWRPMGEESVKEEEGHDRLRTSRAERRRWLRLRRTRWYYLTEAMREIGALSMVFAALDWTLYNVRISRVGILVWILGGPAALLIGIYAAPEVQ